MQGPAVSLASTQAAGCRLFISVAWVQSQSSSRGIYGELSDTEAGFLLVLQFPYKFSSHQMIDFCHLLSRTTKMGPLSPNIRGAYVTPL
jgi:hypothetical protein